MPNKLDKLFAEHLDATPARQGEIVDEVRRIINLDVSVARLKLNDARNRQMTATKPRRVRERLNLTPREAGQVLFGYAPKQAYDMWTRWENGGALSRPAEGYFDMILALSDTPWLDAYLTLRRSRL